MVSFLHIQNDMKYVDNTTKLFMKFSTIGAVKFDTLVLIFIRMSYLSQNNLHNNSSKELWFLDYVTG